MYVLHSTEEQVLRSLAPPTPQILKTGSVDSWLPSFAHGHPIPTYHSSVIGNAQGSRVQVRSKCPMYYSRQANGGLGLASLISWWAASFITRPLLHKDGEVKLPVQSPVLMSVYSELVRFEANVYFFQPAGYACHLRPGGSTADPHHELGSACRDHRHLH